MNPLGHAVASREEFLAVAILIAMGIYGVVRWIRSGERQPDPWESPDLATTSGESSEETPICVRCLTPHTETSYFCPHCGHAVGPYNNYMPFVQLFSEGEIMRSAVDGTARLTPLTIAGYALLSLSTLMLLAPVYWVFLYCEIQNRKESPLSDDSPDAPPIA